MRAVSFRDLGAGGLREGAAEPDPLLAAFAHGGELLVARVRILLLSVVFLTQVVPGADHEIQRVAVPLNLAALALALGFHLLASRPHGPWLGFASSAADVTLVSCGLAAFFLLDRPLVAVNSRAIFELYFLAVGCASFRASWQVCALTGFLAFAQYGVIVAYAASAWDLTDPRLAPFRHGVFDWGIQGARLFLLAAAGALSTLVVVRARHLRAQALLDPASGAATAAAFGARLEEEESRARRYTRPVALAVIGVDRLEEVAAREGQPAADQVLRTVTELVQRSIRRSDFLARTGPDELSLLLPETTAELVVGKLETLRRTVAETRIATGRRAGQVAAVTLSIGVASWPDDGARLALVLERAVARLADARTGGRNRTLGPPLGPAAPPGASPLAAGT
jgi:diguanylate cyclase (GGDEF)-like protein